MSQDTYIATIINANAAAMEKLSNAWQSIFEHIQKDTKVEPPKPSFRVILLPNGITIDPYKITDAYVDGSNVEYETDNDSFTLTCESEDEAIALCRWMHEQRGATVTVFKAT
jgi:hypothetical protein